MITEQMYWKGRDVDPRYSSECTSAIRANAAETILHVNGLLDDLGYTDEETPVNSGWRPSAINAATPGAAPHSAHLTAEAVDIGDDGTLYAEILAHLELLKKWKLNLELDTRGWVHLDTRVGIGYRPFKR
jgi:hypothetical protein